MTDLSRLTLTELQSSPAQALPFTGEEMEARAGEGAFLNRSYLHMNAYLSSVQFCRELCQSWPIGSAHGVSLAHRASHALPLPLRSFRGADL